MIKKRKKEKVEFNTTALPDIVFMLLFFFMVVTVLKDKSDKWEINIPDADHVELVKQQDAFLNIGLESYQDNILYRLENKSYSDLNEFKDGLSNLIAKGLNRSETKIKIKIDKYIAMKEVNMLKTTLQDHKLYDIVYVIEQNKL